MTQDELRALRAIRTLRVVVTVEVREQECPDEALSPHVAEALDMLLWCPEFRGGWGGLRHEHDFLLQDGRVAVVTTEATNLFGFSDNRVEHGNDVV